MQNTISYRRWTLEDIELFTKLQLEFWKEDALYDQSLRTDFPISEQG